MDEQRAWKKSRRRKRLRLLAVVLCFCLLCTTHPDTLETLFAFATGTQDGAAAEGSAEDSTARAATVVKSGTCDGLTWTLDDEGTLTVSGTGDMANYTDSKRPSWENEIDRKLEVKKIVIEDGVTSIGEQAFQMYNSAVEVTIPGSVKSIGSYAFYFCQALEKVTISEGVESIENYAFRFCKMTKVEIPDSVTAIGNFAFRECEALTEVTIPGSVTQIGSQAFYGCTSLGKVIFENCQNNVPSLGSAMGLPFEDCPCVADGTQGIIISSSKYLEAYRGASGWSDYADNIVAAAYTVTYDYSENGGASATQETAEVASGGAVDLTPTAAKDGWEFVGWNTDKDAKTALDSLTMEKEDITLYAIYKKTLTATFYSGSKGNREPAPIQVDIYNKETSKYITLPKLKEWTGDSDNYSINCWLWEKIGSGGQYGNANEGESYLLTASRSFYGYYRRGVTLYFDANGGEGEKEEKYGGTCYVTVKENTIHEATGTDPVLSDGSHLRRTGYTFVGWHKGSTTGTLYQAGKTVATPWHDTTYYAAWTPNTYTVTFDYQGATGGSDTAIMNVTYDAAYGALPEPAKEGYIFKGWYTEENGGGSQVTAETAVTTADAHTLYAYWQEKVYHTVTYNYSENGGTSVTQETAEVANGEAVDLTPTAAKDGWEFVGWNTDKDAKTALDSLTMGEEDITLYAIYKKTLTAKFYSGSAGSYETVEAELYNNATSVRIRMPQMKEWKGDSDTYSAYKWRAEGSGGAEPGGIYYLNDSRSFYGMYTRSVELSFDANGGIGSEAAKTGTRCADVWETKISYSSYGVFLPTGGGISRSGYTFDGWHEGSTTGRKYKSGADINSPKQDTTYYAAWKPNPYTVTFDYQGATGGNDTLSKGVTYDDVYGALPEPTKEGYTFKGWYTEENGGGSQVTAEIAVTTAENHTLYAYWQEKTYHNVTYNYSENGGASATQEIAKVANGEAVDLTPTAAKDGWEFVGWNTDKDATTALGSLTMGEEDITLYAIYKKTLTATFYSGSKGNREPAPIQVDIYNKETGKNIILPELKEWTGDSNNYSAYRWKDAKNDIPKPGKTYLLEDSRSFYGYYRRSVKLYFDANGGELEEGKEEQDGGIRYATVKENTIYKTTGIGVNLLNENCLSRTGYTFAGWNMGSTTGKWYESGEYISPPEYDTTYYAKWTPNPYTVTFDYQGATSGSDTATMDVTYDAAYGALPEPTREGYTFKGWYTETNGGGSQVTAETVVKTAAAHTLYAYWKDETAPDAPVLQRGVTLNADWTKDAQTAIPLSLKDGVAVTELYVSVDGADYTQVRDFTGGSTAHTYPAAEGEHTYRFKAMDAAGNTSEASEEFTVKLDTKKPEFGALTYENKAADLWQWIIGKTSMIIYVPVSDTCSNGAAGSGVTQIAYTMTPVDAAGNPDSGRAVAKTAEVSGGRAKISFFEHFKGTIAITCTDKAGNAASGITVGVNGVIVEDAAPAITSNVQEGFYDAAPELTVTVKDDKGSAITAGIASITYQVGNDGEKTVPVETSALQTEVSFTISASEIPTGVTIITVKAKDSAGNEASETITVKVRGPERQPAAAIHYREEKLTGLVPGADYTVNGTPYTADGDGCIAMDESWIGATIEIVRKGNGSETTDSTAQSLAVPSRPAAPSSVPELAERTDSSITLKEIGGVQYRINGGNGQESPEFTGLSEKTVYAFTVSWPATDTAFASEESSAASIATMPKPPAKEKLAVSYAGETFTLGNGVEAFTDEACTNSVSAGDVTAYMGQTLYIRYAADGEIPESVVTAVTVPSRPSTPTAGTQNASYPGAQDGKLTGLAEGCSYEIRVKDSNNSAWGEWTDAVLTGTEITELAAGEYEVRIKAVEGECFKSEAAAVTIGENPATRYDTPAVRIDYTDETLTGFLPGAQYSVTYIDGNGAEQTTEVQIPLGGIVPVETEWFGRTLSIVRIGNGKDKINSEPESLPVPKRPEKPTPAGADETGWNKKDGKLTGLTADTSYEISTDGGMTWESRTADGNGEITGLAPGSYVVRVKAGASNFAGEQSEPVTVGVYRVKVTFMVNGEIYQTVSVDYGKALTEIPPVPAKKDAGNQPYISEWCSDEQGTPAVFTNLTADMTVYAVYTEVYHVTLVDGTGYTLSAAQGSISPVKSGGSFRFKFTLDKDYEKTGSFAVKVNGVKAELTKDGAYTITDIRENKTVTVEGVQKKTSSGGSGSIDGSGNDSDDNTPAGNHTPTDSNTPADNNTAADNNTPTDSNTSADNGSSSDSSQTSDSNPSGGTDGGKAAKRKEQKEQDGTQSPEQAAEKPSGTEKEQLPEKKGVQIIQASIDNGKITVPGKTVETGNIIETSENTTRLTLGSGAVIVTVVCEEQDYTAELMDTVTVANAVLSPEQIQMAGEGETIEIRVDVKDISKTVPGQDKKVIESGLTECRKEMPDLTLGVYVDISVFVKVGESDWDVVTNTEEPVEVMLGIPEELRGEGREFYIIRSHDGEYAILNDTDNEPDTITIRSDMFSAYAIAYRQAEAPGESGAKCGLCHICPTFLGICCFIWAAVILVILLTVLTVVWRKRIKN